MAWIDTGTFDSLLEAGTFIKTLEQRQGLQVGSPEEIAWRKKWINNDDFRKLGESQFTSNYGKYLIRLLKNK